MEDKELELFPYQADGATWMSLRSHALLADEMGLGKSAQAIVACASRTPPYLIICPAVARQNWKEEFLKFVKLRKSSPLSSIVTILKAADITCAGTADVVIVSYDASVNSKIWLPLLSRRWGCVILDESHYLKNRNSKRTQSIYQGLFDKRGVQTQPSIVSKADAVWCLSGTPMPKGNPAELWSWMRTFNITRLDYWTFVKRYCAYNETPFGVSITGAKNIDELKAMLAPHMLRRTKEEVMKDLPDLLYSDVVVAPGEVPRSIIEQTFPTYIGMSKGFNDRLKEDQYLINAVMGKPEPTNAEDVESLTVVKDRVKVLRQWIGLQKAVSVTEIVKEELQNFEYEKIVIFAVHHSVLTLLMNGLREFSPLRIDGSTPATVRGKHIKEFQEGRKHRVMIGQIQACGIAVNMTAAHQVAIVEADWAPAVNAQAVARCHRIGQTRNVNVRFFALADSIDQKIQRVLKQRTRMLTALFEPEKELPTEIPLAYN